jgi:hypothetical protein
VAYTRLADGSGLVFILGRASKEGWLMQEFGDRWRMLQHFPKLSESVVDGVWRAFQNLHFVTECSGALYLVATAREPGTGNDNYADLFRLEASSRGRYLLHKIKMWKPYYSGHYCNARYAANPVVQNGEISFVCSGGLSDVSGNLGVAEVWQ